MNNYIKEIKAVFIFCLIFTVLILLPNATTLLRIDVNTKSVWVVISIYICLILLFSTLNKFFKKRIFSKVYELLLYPIGILYFLLTCILPFSIILLHGFFYFALSFSIPQIILYCFNCYDSDILSQQTQLYLLISISTFIMVILNFQIKSLVHKISPARINHSEKMKPFEIEKLSNYLLSENNIRFIVYFLYVIILIIINFTGFQLQETFLTENAKPILQSFVTFIAFDRAVSLLKNLSFKPSDFLDMFIKSIKNKLIDFSKKNID